MPEHWPTRASPRTHTVHGVSEVIGDAFPSSVRAAISEVVAELPPTRFEPAGRFAVFVEHEKLDIPERIYNPEISEDVTAQWSELNRAVYACLYTRHHDGHTRQRHLRSILSLSETWVAPFVIRLIGEYVIEILAEIQEGLSDLESQGARRTLYGTFVAANPDFMALTSARVISYWSCYYRFDYPRFADYPGSQLISLLRSASAEN